MLPQRHPSARNVKGFTLVELTVVIMIIAMLMTLAVPAVSQIMREARRSESMSMVRRMTTACREFETDLGWLPYSDHVSYPSFSGSQLLYLQLTGWGPDFNEDGLPNEGNDEKLIALDTDDGKDGWGFRKIARGKVYGPYLGTEGFPSMVIDDLPLFADVFGHPVYYYRYKDEVDAYDNDDNNPPKYPHDSPFIIKDYVENVETGAPWRADFVIFTPGPDGLLAAWDPASDDPTDDVTNFLPE